MPWKTFMCQALNSIDEHCTQSSPSLRLPPRYKALNTFIDDLFAFIIKMPTMHRLSCLRDDFIFLIYLYQRWIYGVDSKRANEYGQVDASEADAPDAAPADAPPLPPPSASSSSGIHRKKDD